MAKNRNLADTKEYRAVSKKLFTSFFDMIYSKGLITKRDLDNKENLFGKIMSVLESVELGLVVDYRDELETQAKAFFDIGKHELSITFYCMYFEHSINSIVVHQLEKRDFSQKTIREVLRGLSFAHKFTWVLQILDLPKFNERHKKIILSAAQERNAFVHYKYSALPDDQVGRDHSMKSKKIVEGSMKAAVYMKRYESRVLFSGMKSKLRNSIM